MRKSVLPITSVSAGRLGGLFGLNRTDSGLVGLFGRDRSDPTAHAKHYGQYKNIDFGVRMIKKILLIVIISIIGVGLSAQLIPDDNFREKINEALGQPVYYQPTIEDLNSLTGTLDSSEAEILSIEGAQFLTNLTNLWFYDNQISDISALSGLSNLSHLQLSNNLINDIFALSGLTDLTNLELEFNAISDISSLSSLMDLESLYLGWNQISDINVLSNMVSMMTLSLDSNLIIEISVLSGLTDLMNLSLNGNQISDISPLSDLVNLTQLGLYNNQIIDISILSNLNNLTWLALLGNQIICISPLSNLTNLEKLYLQYNQVNDISALSNLINLETLTLENNQISDISALSNLTNLTFLKLSYNQISDISSLYDLVNLEMLYLSYNEINDISSLSELTNLYWINLEGNQVTDIYPLIENVGLSSGSLYLGFNPLSYEAIEVHIPILESYDFLWFYYPEVANFNAACYPSPIRHAENVGFGSDLFWYGAESGAIYEVYQGTSNDNLLSIGDGQYIGNNTFTISPELIPETEYWWKVKSTNGDEVLWSGMWHFTTAHWVVLVDEIVKVPRHTVLHNAYPNPFNPSTTIKFFVEKNETAKLKIYNLKGQLVKSYPVFYSGSHLTEWNGKDNAGNKVSSGVYFYKLKSESSAQVHKMLMLK